MSFRAAVAVMLVISVSFQQILWRYYSVRFSVRIAVSARSRKEKVRIFLPKRWIRHCFGKDFFLDGHSGFDRANLGGWLDLFSVMMNPPEDRLEKVALVLDRAMAFPKTLRYRDYYGHRSSSGTWGFMFVTTCPAIVTLPLTSTATVTGVEAPVPLSTELAVMLSIIMLLSLCQSERLLVTGTSILWASLSVR